MARRSREVREHLVGVEVGIGLDDGVDAVAQVLVGQPDHRARPHGGVLLERRLDLGRVDVGAAAQDHVGEPVAEVEEPVGVEPARRRRATPIRPPAPGPRRRRSGSSASSRVDGPQPHLALLARRDLGAVLVGDEHGALGGAADRPPVLEPLRARDDRGGLRLGAGVELPDPLGAQPLDPRLLEPRRAGLGEVPHEPQRRQVVALPHLDRQAPDPLHHRGHEVHDVHRVLLDGGEGGLGVEARQHHQVGAGQQRGARPDDGTVVVERPGHQQAPVGVDPEGRAGLGVQRGGVAGHDELGPTGRAAGGRCLPRGRGGVGQRPVLDRRVRHVAGGQARAPGDRLGLHAHDEPRVGQLDDGLQLGRRAAGRTPAAGWRRASSTPPR